MTDEQNGSSLSSNLFHLAVAFFLKLGITHGKHLVNDKNFGLEVRRNRKTETPESLALRLKTAQKELEYLPEFDYVVVNAHERLEDTVDTIVSILTAEHHRVVPRRVTL